MKIVIGILLAAVIVAQGGNRVLPERYKAYVVVSKAISKSPGHIKGYEVIICDSRTNKVRVVNLQNNSPIVAGDTIIIPAYRQRIKTTDGIIEVLPRLTPQEVLSVHQYTVVWYKVS